MLPAVVLERCGTTRSSQLRAFITAMSEAAQISGEVGMTEALAEALAALRAFNYENIYLRPSSQSQSGAVIEVLQGLVEYYADRPNSIPWVGRHGGGIPAGTDEALREAVTYVAGMTDRFAFQQAVMHLGWNPARLPFGVDVERA
jgi:dGTPase